METLIFETPTPVSEYPERQIGGIIPGVHASTTSGAAHHTNNGNSSSSSVSGTNAVNNTGPTVDSTNHRDDSGIELQEE